MANLQYREAIRAILPPWLRDRIGKTTGYRLVASFATLLDAGAELVLGGLKSSLASQAAPDALDHLGRDRSIPKGPFQPYDAYALELTEYRDLHKRSGGPVALGRVVQLYFGPAASPPMVRVVQRDGKWTTTNPDGSVVVTYPATPWDWDSKTHPERAAIDEDAWIIVYPSNLPDAGTWGDDHFDVYESTKTIGHDTTVANVAAFKRLVQQFKGAHTDVRALIVAYDAASFDPADAATYPTDGLWGHWSKVVAGERLHARTTTARYWEDMN